MEGEEQAADKTGHATILDKMLLASWISIYAILLFVFRLLGRLERRGETAGGGTS